MVPHDIQKEKKKIQEAIIVIDKEKPKESTVDLD